jgi:hypothetical protein
LKISRYFLIFVTALGKNALPMTGNIGPGIAI